jgi:hypothetical protein
MSNLIPVWIIGAPFVGLLILSFSFKGSSAMGGSLPRPLSRSDWASNSSPVVQPMIPHARRNS